MGQATSKGYEAKSKHPSDMPMPRFEHGGSELWSNMLPLDQRRPGDTRNETWSFSALYSIHSTTEASKVTMGFYLITQDCIPVH